MPREDFVKEYMAVRDATFKQTIIQAAWRKSGLWPINCDVFQNVDYAPSIPFSTHATLVPESYPYHQSFSDTDNDGDNDSSDNDSSDEDNEAPTPTPKPTPTSAPAHSPIPPALVYATLI
ncbi:hypothetical protein BT96DRAFT_995323 [Gymnopus androsaceus JB14]|uniref:Uncharacterized protein n=1 Tax=Gymnopus androsaceus JB14 TaxID=1447944 RepID=A0A6A4HJ55_9AGAR|nr:hypothetical protein BT96DRAFT_995323 [Gymnopus androsaceus JB14]